MTDRFLFDKKLSEQKRDQSIDLVEKGADSQWKKEVETAIQKIVRIRETFTTDDVWAAMPEGIRDDVEPRAMGAMMRNAAKSGLCVALSQWKPSVRVCCHRRPLRVWRSLVALDGFVS